MNDEHNGQHRLVAWVSKRDARKFKAKLALSGETFSDWLRRKIKEFIKE